MNVIQNSCLKLVLVTNSAWKVAFRCKDENFLIEVLELIKSKISNNANYVINLEECTITNSQIGEKNIIKQDTNGLKNFVKRNYPNFFADILSGIIATHFIDLIKKLLFS